MIGEQHIHLYSGDYTELEIRVKDPTGVAQTFDSIMASYKIGRSSTSPSPLLELTSENGDIEIISEVGSITLIVKITSEHSKGLKEGGLFYHEARIRDNLGRPFTVMTGQVTVLPTLFKDDSTDI